MHEVFYFDWKETPDQVMFQVKAALEKHGITVEKVETDDDGFCFEMKDGKGE